ncbi:MAG: thiamine phosphate synthase [Cystobacter sp.]
MNSPISEQLARARPRLLLLAAEEGREWLSRVLVAAGARPALVPDSPDEARLAPGAASALVIQEGSCSRGHVARAAAQAAHQAGLPVILTLLGPGRPPEARWEGGEAIERLAPTVLCCDAGGLVRLARNLGQEGPSPVAPDDTSAHQRLARRLAQSLRCTIFLLGARDGFVTDGPRAQYLGQCTLLLPWEADVPGGMTPTLVGAALAAVGSAWEAANEVLKWLGRLAEESRVSGPPALAPAVLHRRNLVDTLAHSASRVARPLWQLLSVYVIVNGRTPDAVVEAILGEGIGALQFREKSLPMAQQLAVARRFQARCHEAGALFLVNDRLDLALAVQADGVHLGQSDLPPAEARRLLGARAIIGASCASPEELAIVAGADYVGTGPVYSTLSKQDAGAAVGAAAVEQVCREYHGPVVGIGGIHQGRAAPVIRAGACGVSVISAVLDAPDPAAAARALLLEVRHTRQAVHGASFSP